VFAGTLLDDAGGPGCRKDVPIVGGKLMKEPVPIPNVAMIACLLDPEGRYVELLKSQ